jgi:hypothetical protein
LALLLSVLAGVLWLLSVVIFIIFGQHPRPTYVIFNNTGAGIEVIADGASLVVAAGDSGEIPVHDARKLQPFLIESAGGKRLKYTWMPVGERRLVRGGRVFWQIEPDLKIYVLLPVPEDVVRNLPPQPIGFPLEPQK